MPQFQMIEPEQSFGNQIGEALGTGLGRGVSQGISSQIQNFQKQKQNRSQLGGILDLLESQGMKFEPEQKKSIIESGLSPDIAATGAFNLFKSQEAAKAKKEESLVKQQQASMKQQQDEQEQQQMNQSLSEDFDYLDSLTPYAGSTKIPFTKSATYGGLNREAIEKREEIDSLGFWMTDRIYTHFNKGTMSDAKLDLLKNELRPKSDLSERAYRARVNSLRRISRLPRDIKPKELNSIINDEVKNIRKIPKNAPGETQSPIAINEETGERLILKEGKWQPHR